MKPNVPVVAARDTYGRFVGDGTMPARLRPCR